MGQIRNKALDKKIGSRVAGLRSGKLGLKQKEFTEEYEDGLDYETLRQLEGGHVTVSAATLKWLAQKLGTTSDYLLGLTETESKAPGVRETVDEYGLDEDALKTLSDYVKDVKFIRFYQPPHPRPKGYEPPTDATYEITRALHRRPLDVLNLILSNRETGDDILILLHGILFENIRERSLEIIAHGRTQEGIPAAVGVYGDELSVVEVAQTLTVKLYGHLARLRDQLSTIESLDANIELLRRKYEKLLGTNPDLKPGNKNKPNKTTPTKKGANHGQP